MIASLRILNRAIIFLLSFLMFCFALMGRPLSSERILEENRLREAVESYEYFYKELIGLDFDILPLIKDVEKLEYFRHPVINYSCAVINRNGDCRQVDYIFSAISHLLVELRPQPVIINSKTDVLVYFGDNVKIFESSDVGKNIRRKIKIGENCHYFDLNNDYFPHIVYYDGIKPEESKDCSLSGITCYFKDGIDCVYLHEIDYPSLIEIGVSVGVRDPEQWMMIYGILRNM